MLSFGRNEIILYDDAKYRERKEANGVFAAIPAILRTFGRGGSGGSGAQLALPPAGTTESYRSGASSPAPGGRLPSNYTYEQWQADLRRWEAETGMTYEQYLRQQGGQGARAGQAAPRAALPPSRASPQPGGGAYMQQPAPQQQAMQQPQQQRYAQAPAAGAGGGWDQGSSRYGQQPGADGAAWYGAQAGGQQAGGRPPVARQPSPMGQPDPRQRAAPGGQYYQQQAPAQQQGYASPQQQQRPPLQQQQQQPGMQQAQPSGQPQAAGAAAGGQPRVQAPQRATAPAGGAPAGQPMQQQPQQQQAPGRPVEEWIDKDTRPRMSEVLIDGALAVGEGSSLASGLAGGGGLGLGVQESMEPAGSQG